MAKALNIWKRHKPKPNYQLAALFARAMQYGPRWWKSWGIDEEGKRIPGFKPIRIENRKAVSTASVIAIWKRKDPKCRDLNTCSNKERLRRLASARRKIERYAREFGIPLELRRKRDKTKAKK
jgi:hypothetical protein